MTERTRRLARRLRERAVERSSRERRFAATVGTGPVVAILMAVLVVTLIFATAPAGASPAGRTYSTTYGDMTFSGSGRATYNGSQSGTIQGTLSGRVLTGQWGETAAAVNCGGGGPLGTEYWGRIVFTFSADFSSFEGVWSYCDAEPTRGWSGTSTTPTPTTTTVPDPPPCEFTLDISLQLACPPPGPVPGPKPRVKFAMPQRYGLPDGSRFGIIRPTETVIPERFKVVVTVKRSDGSRCSKDDKVTQIDIPEAKSVRPKPGNNPCKFVVKFDKEGRYRAKVTLESDGKIGTRRTWITVQDWLIVGIGDSNGAGEGEPDIAGPPTPRWVDLRCDRSGRSHQALSAAAVERQDPKTSVTFVHLACSGAKITSGLLSGYEGINPSTPDLPPQMDELVRLVGDREVDALLISIGVNDLLFGPMVDRCVKTTRCPRRIDVGPPVMMATHRRTLREGMEARLAALPRLYGQLAQRIRDAGIDPGRVYITEYFDSTKDENGETCDPLIRVGGDPIGLDFDKNEAQWAHDQVLVPLNRAVATAAARHGWNLVSGAYRDFRYHGYCANSQLAGQGSWIVTLPQSESRQGDANGTLHANFFGNLSQSDNVYGQLRKDLYPNGGRVRLPTT